MSLTANHGKTDGNDAEGRGEDQYMFAERPQS